MESFINKMHPLTWLTFARVKTHPTRPATGIRVISSRRTTPSTPGSTISSGSQPDGSTPTSERSTTGLIKTESKQAEYKSKFVECSCLKAGPCVCALEDAGGLLDDYGADKREHFTRSPKRIQEQRCGGFCWRLMVKLRSCVTRKK